MPDGTEDQGENRDAFANHSPLSRRQFGGLTASTLAAIQLAGTGAGDAEVPAADRESTSYEVAGLKESAEILVDKWGVPHMYADDIGDIAFVQGFNAARDRLWQIDLWNRRSLGRLSEALGEDWVEHDRAARLFMYRDDIEDEWAAYGPDAKTIATGFAEGINAFIDQTETNPDLLPIEFEALGYEPKCWDPEDVVRMRSHAIALNVSNEVERAITLRDHGEDVERVRERLSPEDWDLEVPDGLDLDAIPEDILDVFEMATMSHTDISFETDDIQHPEVLGNTADIGNATCNKTTDEYNSLDTGTPTASNNWAIAPELTPTGRPILANDPHRAHNAPSLRYIEHINSPEFDVIGAGEPGLPGISIGHNGNTAFGLTIFYIDQKDLYVYETNPENPDEYRYEDQWVSMEACTETIEVRDGKDVEVELKFTKHGPVIYEDPEQNTAFAVRTVWTDPGTTAYFGGIGYMRAESVDEFETAMEGRLTDEMMGWGTPPENQIAADTEGNIGWIPGGRTPIRPNWDGLFPVPGDGRYEWDGYLDQSNLPREINPDRGWVATANEFNIPDDHPVDDPPLGFDGWAAPYRYLRIEEVLEEFSEDNQHSLEDSADLQTDFLSIPLRILTETLADIETGKQELSEICNWLADWDNVLSVDSGEAALAVVWFENYLQEAITVELVGEETYEDIGTGAVEVLLEAVEEPEKHFDEDPVRTRNKLLLSTLDSALEEVCERLGDDRDTWRWGDLKHAYFEHSLSTGVEDDITETLNVGPEPMGGGNYTVGRAGHDDNFQLTHGGSWRMVIDVGEWDNSLAINVPGQSGDSESPFYDNLLEKFVNGEYFPLLYTRDAVQDACVKRIGLKPATKK